MEDSSIIFQLISLVIIVLWTVRLARSKGLNPLLWGIGSALLMALAWAMFEEQRGFVVFIGMAPLVFLLLFRSPLFRRRSDSASTSPVTATHSARSCPRCTAPEAGGQNYCVHCGWDLSQTYTPAAETDEITAAPPATAPAPEPATTVLETTLEEIKAAPATESASEPSEVVPPEPAIPAVTPEPAPVLAQDTEPPPPPPPPTPTETAPAAPAPPRRIPTAANLTERGIALFRQGRFQEAVDQFTKAIALDPKYKQAWEQRAEAYGRLGRAERQAADRRQLETI